MKQKTVLMLLIALGCATVLAQSNIDPTNKYGWTENVGWTNWRDAGGTLQGVHVDDGFMSGFIWAENVGHINVGNGGGPYGNTDHTDFGINIDSNGDLHGLAWGENIGWLNFDGGALATPPRPARLECDGRLSGFVWSENTGWLNLDDTTHFVSVEGQFCGDLDGDGDVDATDYQLFLSAFGSSDGELAYIRCADFDTDGVVSLIDYTAWIECYRDFVGDPLAPPPVGAGVGDINQDGALDGRDIQEFVAVATDPANASPTDTALADINGDGVIDITDAGGLVGLLLAEPD